MTCCPTCGRKYAKAVTTDLHPSEMGNLELFAYYKRIAPIEDLKFFLKHAEMTSELRSLAEALLSEGPHTMTRALWNRRMSALHAQWRAEHNLFEQANRIVKGWFYNAATLQWEEPNERDPTLCAGEPG